MFLNFIYGFLVVDWVRMFVRVFGGGFMISSFIGKVGVS